MKYALAACILAGLVGCKTVSIQTEASDAVDLSLKVSAPHEVIYFVNGEARCTSKGSQAVKLRAKPGTCLNAGDDGVLKPCQ